MVRALIAALALLLAALPAAAQSFHTPPPGSAERRALLDAVRPLVHAELGAPVEFVVRTLRVGQGWAFAVLEPQRPGGHRILAPDPAFNDGVTTYAVLRNTGQGWRPLMVAVGPTDVPYVVYCDAAPRGLFGPVCS